MSSRNEASASPNQRFARRAEEIARAADRDTIPFGLRRRVVLRLPIPTTSPCARPAPDLRGGEEEILLPEGLGCAAATAAAPSESASNEARDLARVRGLLAQVALDLIARVLVINRYFADAGLVASPEVGEGGPRDRPDVP